MQNKHLFSFQACCDTQLNERVFRPPNVRLLFVWGPKSSYLWIVCFEKVRKQSGCDAWELIKKKENNSDLTYPG